MLMEDNATVIRYLVYLVSTATSSLVMMMMMPGHLLQLTVTTDLARLIKETLLLMVELLGRNLGSILVTLWL